MKTEIDENKLKKEIDNKEEIKEYENNLKIKKKITIKNKSKSKSFFRWLFNNKEL